MSLELATYCSKSFLDIFIVVYRELPFSIFNFHHSHFNVNSKKHAKF